MFNDATSHVSVMNNIICNQLVTKQQLQIKKEVTKLGS